MITKPGEDAAAARRNYGRNAFGLAGEYGLHQFGHLRVTEVVVGDFSPEVVVFYTWPSASAEAEFNADPAWQPIKATRLEGWDELRIHDRVVEQPIQLQFSADKYYTTASAWLNPDRPDDYATYLASIEPTLNELGGRFVMKVIDASFSSISPDTQAPSQLTFVEWDSEDALQAFLQSDGFKQYTNLLTQGTSAFELVRLAVP